MRKPPLVVVTWRDAFLRSSAATQADAVKDDEHQIRFTVGWLVEDGEKVVRVAMTYDPNGPGEEPEFDDRYTIPRPYVQEIRFITRRPRKKAAKETAGVSEG